MQSDIFTRCAPENAADAGRYVANIQKLSELKLSAKQTPKLSALISQKAQSGNSLRRCSCSNITHDNVYRTI